MNHMVKVLSKGHILLTVKRIHVIHQKVAVIKERKKDWLNVIPVEHMMIIIIKNESKL
jgi:hypothetical protein